MAKSDRVARRGLPSIPCTLLACCAIAVGNPWAQALAGCGVGAPELLAGPAQMPSNGTISLLLTHPMWHSRRAATGPREDGAPLGSDVTDLPFVLSRNGKPDPLQIRAKHELRGGVVVTIAPAAGWLPGATYELRADVATQRVYPSFTVVAGPDTQPPTWGTETPTATVIKPPVPESERPPKPSEKHCATTGSGKSRKTECTTTTYAQGHTTTEHCITTGTGKQRTSECSMSGSFTTRLNCPPEVTEAHVELHLPAVTDDHGGALMLEVRRAETISWVPAAQTVAIGLVGACTPANFPPPGTTPYELQVTPVDAAQNRGITLRIPVSP